MTALYTALKGDMILMRTLSIRPALPTDSPDIASVMRCGSTALMRHFTVIGCTGLEAYIHDQITAGSPTHYLVAVEDDRLIGMSAWRCEGEYLFLKHLFVLPSTQGRGVGTALWSHGISHFQFRQPRYLALDTHDDSPKSRSWYLALGMAVVGHKTLMKVPLFPPKSTTEGNWSSSFLEATDPHYSRYGFSQFTLITEHATYTIGRLGTSLFRASACAILDDDTALNALHSLDKRRALLCIATAQELESAAQHCGVVVGVTESLVTPLDVLADRVRERCAVLNNRPHRLAFRERVKPFTMDESPWDYGG